MNMWQNRRVSNLIRVTTVLKLKLQGKKSGFYTLARTPQHPSFLSLAQPPTLPFISTPSLTEIYVLCPIFFHFYFTFPPHFFTISYEISSIFWWDFANTARTTLLASFVKAASQYRNLGEILRHYRPWILVRLLSNADYDIIIQQFVVNWWFYYDSGVKLWRNLLIPTKDCGHQSLLGELGINWEHIPNLGFSLEGLILRDKP